MKLTLTLSVDNAAFAENGGHEVARILREAAAELNAEKEIWLVDGIRRLWDINGNRIGYLTVSD